VAVTVYPSPTIPVSSPAVLSTKLTPQTSGGLSVFQSLDLDETEEDIKTSAGQIYGWHIMNTTAATLYVKFYNDTAANVVVGTTATVFVLAIPAGSGAIQTIPGGIAFSAAISAAATTGVAANDTGAPAANALVITVFYT
jgi:hypothetical protein